MSLTAEELKAQEALTFNNDHNPEAEAFEIQIDFGQISSWDDPYKLFINGELDSSFKSWNGAHKKAQTLIKAHDLKVVRD